MLKFLHMERQMQGHGEADRSIFPTLCTECAKMKISYYI
jgi:hypothetical protein